MRNIISAVVTTFCLLFTACGTKEKKERNQIDIMLFGGHPLLKSVEEGIKKQFFKRLIADNKDTLTYKFQTFDAGFKPSNAIQQTRIAFAQNPVALVALGTPSISALLSQTNDIIPLFFGATNDPFKLGFTKDSTSTDWRRIQLTTTNDNVSGYVSAFNFPSIASLIVKVMELNKKNTNKAKTIGYPITTTENNSRIALNIIRFELEKQGYTIIESAITSSNETMRAARDLIDRNSALIQIGPDNTVVGGMSSILSATQGYDIPVLASDRETVNKGAMCAVGIDFIKLGEALGDMIYDRLENKSKTIPKVLWFSDNKLFINNGEINKQLGTAALDSLKAFSSRRGIQIEIVK